MDGGGGNDTLDYGGQASTQVTITGAGSVDGFAGAASLIGGGFNDISAFADLAVLTGPGAGNTWDITGADSGTLTSIFGVGSASGTWSNVAALQGGSLNDTFLFDGGSEGSVDGQSGPNTLDYHLQSGRVDVTLTGAGSVVGYQGTAADDRLRGGR